MTDPLSCVSCQCDRESCLLNSAHIHLPCCELCVHPTPEGVLIAAQWPYGTAYS